MCMHTHLYTFFNMPKLALKSIKNQLNDIHLCLCNCYLVCKYPIFPFVFFILSCLSLTSQIFYLLCHFLLCLPLVVDYFISLFFLVVSLETAVCTRHMRIHIYAKTLYCFLEHVKTQKSLNKLLTYLCVFVNHLKINYIFYPLSFLHPALLMLPPPPFSLKFMASFTVIVCACIYTHTVCSVYIMLLVCLGRQDSVYIVCMYRTLGLTSWYC